ncbi:EAL domain-containing protein [Acetobacterium sp.]|uniref:EAL domain-containing protein n=1 Tax=Acetobacterium sp. TaxID=1872094 RepID=UPI0035943167
MKIKNNKNKNLLMLGIIFTGLIFMICFPLTSQALDNSKRVLFISSYSESFPTVPQQIKGIQSALAENITMEIEYMDTKRLDTSENKRLFYEHLAYKLKNLPPYDAVLVGDDNALQFMMDYHDELFPQIPVVFFGINDLERGKKAAESPYFTGMIEKFSMVETIEIAKKFNPQASSVVGIVDSTLTGQGDQGQFLATQTDFDEMEFRVLNVSDYTFDEFGLALVELDHDVILLYLSMNQDKSGAVMNQNEQYQFLKNHTTIPIYRTSIGGIGKGIFGGKLIDYEAIGRTSGNLVMEILNGNSVATMSLFEETPYYYIFDYELIKLFKIPDSLIPQNAVLVNKDPSPLETYREILIGIGVIMFFLLVITVILIVDNLKRRTIQKELRQSYQKLQRTNEYLAKTEDRLRNQYEVIEKSLMEVGILNQKYAIATEITNSAVWELDLETKEVNLSDNFSMIANHKINENENIETILNLLKNTEYREALISEIKAYLQGSKQEINIQVPIEDENNETKWILIRGRAIARGDGSIKQIHGILMDTTKMKEQEDYIAYLATHDYLTKLPNRMSFLEKLTEVLEADRSGAVLLFDIDNFKEINDTQGHVYGDKILEKIAYQLDNISREKMFVSRLGGDEFLILLENVNDKEEIEKFAQMTKKAFENAFILEGRTNFINISMGITCFPEDSNDINQIIMNADTAMYHVKHSGKNNYIFYHNDMKNALNARIEIEAILREALETDGFKLLYQPQVDLNTRQIHGFEALLRLKNHRIRPDQFIPVAEETGLIIDIGRWVAKAAIEQFAAWRKSGLGEKTIAINYSSKQLSDKAFITYLTQLLKANQIRPELIEIEITESILLENNNETMLFLQELKAAGLRIALDDFGTGYSSLNYLTYIPVDKVKLDKSINDKFLNLKNNNVMDSLILLAHSLKLKITAEGIEEWDQYLQLKRGGCDYIQGYLFSKPLDSMDAEKIYNHTFVMADD